MSDLEKLLKTAADLTHLTSMPWRVIRVTIPVAYDVAEFFDGRVLWLRTESQIDELKKEGFNLEVIQ